jgi:cyanophycinase
LTLKINIPGSGTLALVGSGEYLIPMQPVDRYLMGQLAAKVCVACLPTAAGQEGEERISYWSSLGEAYFKSLGADKVEALPVINRTSANDPRLAECIRQANFIYLSGGKPDYLYRTLVGSAVWEAVLDVLTQGGIVAGCSAGAMIFGERIPGPGFGLPLQDAFGFLPGTLVIPHYDEIHSMIANKLPLLAGKLDLVGIEGDTALVCSNREWRVVGKGGVTFGRGDARTRHLA